jgi:toxin-antitoxin system PIN domain toxin
VKPVAKPDSEQRLLLDVNVLLALGWAEHQAHSRVVARLHDAQPWATCAIVQLGFIRLSSTAGIFHQPLSPQRAAQALQTLVADTQHSYLSEQSPPCAMDWGDVSGPKQTTDRFLLGLAQAHGARLLTLDRRLSNAFTQAPLELLEG